MTSLSSRLMVASVVALMLVACGADDAPAPPGAPATQAESPAGESPGATNEGTGNITLTVAVDGAGKVQSQPAGIDCPGTCTATFAPGTQVKLVQSAGEGWAFKSWSGACSGQAISCAFTVDADVKVGAKLSLLDPRWDPSVGDVDCAAAWGTAGEKLHPCDKTKDDYVVIHKSKRNTALCKSGSLIKNFRSGLGFAPAGTKVQQSDGKTPEGVFYIPRLVPDSSYYKAFLLSYPTKEDATRGFTDGLIDATERDQILTANDTCKEPLQGTDLGGLVEIHGNGSDQDWTHGCIALEDDDVDVLWVALGVGDTIVVLP